MNFLTTEVRPTATPNAQSRQRTEWDFCKWTQVRDVLQGYLDAAKTFEKESGTPMDRSVDCSQERMIIRNAVEHGELEHAISQVNDLNPEVCPYYQIVGP